MMPQLWLLIKKSISPPVRHGGEDLHVSLFDWGGHRIDNTMLLGMGKWAFRAPRSPSREVWHYYAKILTIGLRLRKAPMLAAYFESFRPHASKMYNVSLRRQRG